MDLYLIDMHSEHFGYFLIYPFSKRLDQFQITVIKEMGTPMTMASRGTTAP